MNSIQDSFSIKDLENISGIKAHTLRMWEKRYQLLSPSRTGSNIRYYSRDNLQKLLNITLLNSNGFKISKISKLSENELIENCINIITEQSHQNLSINDFKISMLNFDQDLFEKTYNKLLANNNFREIYVSYFIPFLSEIGRLWHTDTINPSHEHFITSLIKQKILLNIALIKREDKNNVKQNFVLFLPDNEIHEVGLLFLNYELLKKGHSTIFLGQSMPINSLHNVLKNSIKTIFISYFTIYPENEKIESYLNKFSNTILKKSNHELWILGRKIDQINTKKKSNIKTLKVEDFLDKI